MLQLLIDNLAQALQNQFLSGGLVLMVTAAILALCRKLPEYLWKFLLRRFTVTVDVSNDDPLFAWVSLWLAELPYSLRARSLTATSERDDHGRVVSPTLGDRNEIPQILFTPAPGAHLFRYGRRLVWLSREQKETPGKDDSIMSFWKREVFKIRVIGFSQKAARLVLEEARTVALRRRHRKIEIFAAHYDSWQQVDERDPRSLATVFLPEGVTERLTGDLDAFLKSQQWYAERGIPWQRTYLFHGVTGSGKTSLIMAMAGHFRMNVHLLNLGNPYLTDDSLLQLLARVPSRSFVLLEDIDAAFNQREKSDEAKNKLTFSGLLNALNGAASKDGAVVFMTTNHIERLDPALIRAGRADVKQEFGPATADQANRMFCAFFPEAGGADGFGDKVEALRLSMCDVQNHLIDHKDSSVKALNLLTRKDKAA